MPPAMYPELIALTASALFGGCSVLLKRGYIHASPLASNLVIAGSNVVVFWIIALLFVPLHLFFTTGIIFFIIGGVLGQALARTMQYQAIDKIGPSRNNTIIASLSLFAAFFAILMLKEKLTWEILIGTLLILFGVILLMREKGGHWDKKYAWLSFIPAVIYGFVITIQKMGLDIVQNAIVGTTAATTAAFIAMLIYAISTRQTWKLMKVGKALPFFMVAGLLNSIGLLMNFYAIQAGTVTRVTPLIATQPLFILVYSHFFLKGHERLTWNVVFGALLVVAGVVAIAVF
jgi:drug/metabolite transporter (DMT)-like permease